METNVYGQVKSWIDQGLESRAISRDLDENSNTKR